MSSGMRLALVWLLGGAVALLVALLWSPAVYYEGDVLPTGHDSFYHARRILDAAENPTALAQFDARIHAPDGSWIPWPWGYDFLMATVASASLALDPMRDPLQVLVFVPPVWAFVTAGLLLAIASTLGLGLGLRLIAVMCFAVSPLTQNLHGLGRIDHHFFEYSLVLAALLTGLRWLRAPASVREAVVCGLVVGGACAFHNGLFLLQLPLLGAAGILWLRGTRLPVRATASMSAALVVAAAVAAAPSIPFREGIFAYDLLSWFHVYVAACTATVLALMAWLPRGVRSGVVLGVVALALGVPLLVEMRSGLDFVGMDIAELQSMVEAQPVFGGTGAEAMPLGDAVARYSALVLALPLVMLASVWLAFRSERADRVFFYVFVVFGGSLLLAQYRFHHFGSLALYLPLLLWCQAWVDRRAGALPVAVAAAAVAAIAYLPVTRTLGTPPAPGFAMDYVVSRSVYPPLAEACDAHQGVVLADHNDGHFIRYHTECAVIANNLILSDQSREKIRETRELFALSPEGLRTRAPWIDYVLVRREDNVLDATIGDDEIRRLHEGIAAALLLEPPPFPDGYRLIHQVEMQRADGSRAVVARAFRIEPANVASLASSSSQR